MFFKSLSNKNQYLFLCKNIHALHFINSDFKNYVRLDGSSISGYGGIGSSFNTGVTLIDDAGNAGMPTAEWYMLISAGGEGTRCQLAIALFTGKIYWRNCAAGRWSEWVQKI